LKPFGRRVAATATMSEVLRVKPYPKSGENARTSADQGIQTLHIRDDAGQLLGKVKGAGVKWRPFVWNDAQGHFEPVPGVYPTAKSAETALFRRLSR
jgi:hypothetical protein